jgi:integrase
VPLTLRKRGRYWHARGSVPARQADGKIGRVRIEESTHVESRVRARKIAADIERYYHELAYYPERKRGPTFAEAAITYIQTRGRSDRFVTKLIKHFGETPISEIDQAKAVEAAQELYPGASLATHNRAVYTPLLAIGATGLRRPGQNARSRPVEIPSDAWFAAVLPSCPPRLGALLVFLTLTGRRVGEAIALTEADVDYERGTVLIERTKTGVPVVAPLPDIVRSFLLAANGHRYTGNRPNGRLFGYSRLTSAHVALTRVCKLARVPRYGFHAIGRHSFATRALKAGKSLKWTQQAGGWKTIKMVADRYSHLEQSEIHQDILDMGAKWGQRFEKGGK